MQAIMKMSHEVGDVVLNEVKEPKTSDDMVKVKIKYCGICGTDIHIYHDTFKYYPPVIMGHEGSGDIVETGRNIRHLKVGDRVALLGSTMIQCGECEYCRSGKYMFCPARRGMGHGVDGMFTEYVVVREDQCYVLPDDVSYEMGALMEAFGTAANAVEELTTIHAGDVALVTGPGPIGLMCAGLLVKKGCYVIVAGTQSDINRLNIAKRLGVQRTINLQTEDMGSVINGITGFKGVDVAFEASGNADAIASCLASLKKLGSYIQTGITGKDRVGIPFDTILYKQLSVFGALGHTLETWDRMVQIYRRRLLDLEPLVTHKMPFSQWRKAFELCENKQALKVLLHP